MKEIWKPCSLLNCVYAVSNYGAVKRLIDGDARGGGNAKKGKIMKLMLPRAKMINK